MLVSCCAPGVSLSDSFSNGKVLTLDLVIKGTENVVYHIAPKVYEVVMIWKVGASVSFWFVIFQYVIFINNDYVVFSLCFLKVLIIYSFAIYKCYFLRFWTLYPGNTSTQFVVSFCYILYNFFFETMHCSKTTAFKLLAYNYILYNS